MTMSSSARSGRPLLSVERVSVRFGGIRALDDLSLVVEPGEVVGLIGPNGAGKTTLMNCLSGLVRPDNGRISLDGVNITGMSPDKRARLGLTRTFQNLRIFGDLTVAENVEFAAFSLGSRASAVERATRSIDSAGLAALANMQVRNLSYGDQRRVELARATVSMPKLLALDEPAAGLNETDTRGLMTNLRDLNRQHGLGALLVDHDMRLIADACHRIIVLHQGAFLLEGEPSEVLGHPEVARIYLGREPDHA